MSRTINRWNSDFKSTAFFRVLDGLDNTGVRSEELFHQSRYIMVIKSRNNWGSAGGMEAQRGDLWVLDMESVLAEVRQADFAYRLELPQTGDTLQFARQVSFPEARISDVEMRTLNTPKLYPGFDEAVGGVRVDFLVDSTSTGYGFGGNVTLTSKAKRSKIYSLLYGWRILARVGRLPYNSEDISVPLPTTPGPLGALFKKDVTIYFLQGTMQDFSGVDSNEVNNITSAGMDVSMAFVMKKCWISSLQLNGVDQSSSNSPLTLSAVLIPEEIYPIDPTPSITANIAMRSSAFVRNPGIGLA